MLYVFLFVTIVGSQEFPFENHSGARLPVVGAALQIKTYPRLLYFLGRDFVYQETQIDLTLIRGNIEMPHLQLGLDLRHGFIIHGLRNKNHLRAATSNCPSTDTKRFKITPATEAQ